MSWEVLLPLIAKYGVPYVIELIRIIQAHPDPATSIEELKLLASKKWEDYGLPPYQSGS